MEKELFFSKFKAIFDDDGISTVCSVCIKKGSLIFYSTVCVSIDAVECVFMRL